MHLWTRIAAMSVAAASGAAMLYVGLYQSRVVNHLLCPIFGRGCETVADAPFARPFGVPDGYLAAGLYAAMIVLLAIPAQRQWLWVVLMMLASLAALANFLGVRDMAQLGSFCFYCVTTTALSPVLLWLAWRLR